MQSTLKLRESDPHDVFSIAPDIVPASWADKVLADITRDTRSVSSDRSLDQPLSARAAAGSTTPKVDVTFRAAAGNDTYTPTIRTPNVEVPSERPAGPSPTRSWVKKTIAAFLFALCSAMAAAAWQHYGAAARQMISAWTPPLTLSLPFSLNLSAPEPTGLAAQPEPPAVEASAEASPADQAPPQAALAQPTGDAAPAAPAPAADDAKLQSMARDLAAMGQEVELLKATVAELKSAQQPLVRDAAKTSEVKPAASNPRPRISPPPPPRTAALPSRRPAQAYATQSYPAQTYPAQAYPAQNYPPQNYPSQAYPPAQAAPPPPPPATMQADDEPVVRPPMPLH